MSLLCRLCGFLLLLLGPVSWAAGQAPSISYCVPSAARPGESVDITIHGGNLAGATAVWTNLNATVELAPDIENNGKDAAKITYRVSLPADAPVTIGGLRLWTPGGVSNLRLLMADDLPSGSDNGANKSVETAQEITLPIAVDGYCDAESHDYYKFNGLAGQRVSVEAVARRLGSPLDPAIRLLDSHGKELAYSDDEGGIGADSRFATTLPSDGVYLIEIRDIRYHGDGNHRYRLRVGDFPIASAAFPMGGQHGTSPKISAVGTDAEDVPDQWVKIPAAADQPCVPFSVHREGGQGSAFGMLVASDLREVVEFEPNDKGEQASPVSLPAAINGRFADPRDRDFYQFAATKGQRFIFRGVTRSLASPSDLFMRIYKPDGAQLAEAEDSGTNEGRLDFTAPEDGTYQLMVEDLHRRGGPEHCYRVEVRPYAPGFSLDVEAERFNVPLGGVFQVKVTSQRRDYNGPITLSLEGLSQEGLSVGNNTILEGKNETVMSITVPAAWQQGSQMAFRVVGTAKIGEQDVHAMASTLAPQRGAFSGLPYPPATLDGQIGLGIGGPFADFFKLSVPGGHAALPQLIGAGTLVVSAEKLNKFDDPINLAVEGLPPGITAEVKPIEKGKNEVAIALKGPIDLAEGDFPIRIVGLASFQNQPKSVVLDTATIRVVKPLGITLQPAGNLIAGGAQKLKITLARYGEEKPAVNVQLENLPLGVSAPEAITIAEGQNELEIDLNAAADAQIGKVENLTASATTTIMGRTIQAESAPVALEVTMP